MQGDRHKDRDKGDRCIEIDREREDRQKRTVNAEAKETDAKR